MGFIGSALVRDLVAAGRSEIVNVDKLTYAANPASLQGAEKASIYQFVEADISDARAINQVFVEHRPDAVMHLAAESHVDRSIDGPGEFVQTNLVGTYTLLQAALEYWRRLDSKAASRFRFLHVSTDEVFGSLGSDGSFAETHAYQPSSPYSASKAGADHLVRAWHHTYGLPVIITNCSNNYGPCQFPEKLIPLMILKAIAAEPMPVYGKGNNVRDWLYVDDHVKALELVLDNGRPGETYNIGGDCELSNIEVVEAVCEIVDELRPQGAPHKRLITFVDDRPGHDFRYAMNSGKIQQTLGWHPDENFGSGLRKTVNWYLENQPWWQAILDGRYRLDRQGKGKSAGGRV
jgi:dTDP-glucose 4,6-dehydratase